MDETAQPIKFNTNGQCNYCEDFLVGHRLSNSNNKISREKFLEKVKQSGSKRDYDCIVGVSGGLDSSYALVLAVKSGLRPLAVHLDNGWNSDLAVTNINNLVSRLNVDLYTQVIDWEENKDLQKSFIKANVVDIELLMDNAMLSLNYRLASKYGLKFILSGSNTATEGVRMPESWNWLKFDAKNIRAIHKKYGTKKIKTHKLISVSSFFYYRFLCKIDWVPFLDYYEYRKDDALKLLEEEYDYRRYPYKHYESVFTRFYQGHILPNKFKIDKRKLHLSNLILTDQLSRSKALELLSEDPYPSNEQFKTDFNFVLKKFEMSEDEFEHYLSEPRVEHSKFPNSKKTWDQLKKIYFAYVQK